MENVFIITREDKLISLKEWQTLYGLKASPKQIGKYFFLDEHIFASNLKEYGRLYVCELLIRVMDAFREAAGRPLSANSFNRSEAKQELMRKTNLRAATTSPHVVYLAVDIDTTSAEETKRFVKLLIKVAKKLGIAIRIGYVQYMKDGNTFIHIDVTPEYYAKGKTRHAHPHPAVWEVPFTIW